MDRNTIIGLSLIFLLFFGWQYMTAPTEAQIEAEKRTQDSLVQVERRTDSLARLETAKAQKAEQTQVPDSLLAKRLSSAFGPFAPAASGKAQDIILENALMRVTFTTRGGRIKEVLLKKHFRMVRDEKRNDVKEPLYLMNAPKNRFDYLLPIEGIPSGGINTGDLFFESERTGNTLVFRAKTVQGGYFEQRYTLPENDYSIGYSIKLENVENLEAGAKTISLNWVNYLNRIEKASQYERTYATIYYKPEAGKVTRCSPTKDSDMEDSEGAPIRWVSSANQFFNSSLVTSTPFSAATIQTKSLGETAPYMKVTSSEIQVPVKAVRGEGFNMDLYIGPNEFKRLYDMGHDLEEVVPFGRSILGTINRWVVRPIFTGLSQLSLGAGMVIFLLTLLVKLVLFPLSYRMLYAQSKMTVLKPEMEKLKEKYKDDQQRQQMETMNLYREFGVNPLGSCMPMLLQMPIWIALYRFFPASIEFRQKGFWWANDLSSYDEFFQLPFSIPFGFGDHISLFTLLWVLTTLIYTWYNSKNMDFSANPALKYMQYIMPVMFMGFFNGYASGLTAYLLFSNVINIGQTLVTKQFIIDEEKIKREMEEFRKKPKTKKGFTARLEQALKDQQQIAEQKQANLKKKK